MIEVPAAELHVSDRSRGPRGTLDIEQDRGLSLSYEVGEVARDDSSFST